MDRVIKFTVIAKKWFDRVNGNTYHSVRCVRCSDSAIVVGSFQYGYGEHYKQTALAVMWLNHWLPTKYHIPPVLASSDYSSIYHYERENNYPILWSVSDGLKRDCVANEVL